MNKENNKKKINARKKFISRVIVLAVALVMVLASIAFFPAETKAGNTTLTIKARYFGFPTVTKAEIGLDELCSIGGGYSATYTTTTNGSGSGFLSYGQGTGATLQNVLTYAGVNTEMASRFNFISSDGHNESKEYMVGTLLNSPRYYFPDLSKYFERNIGINDPEGIMSTDEIVNNVLWVNAKPVETMIAAYECLEKVDDYSEFSGLTEKSDKAFRLMFGQTSPTEKNAIDFIYGIHTIIVTYDGTPEISADDVEFKVGEDQKIEVSIMSLDADISQLVMDGLKFSSSDTSVVKVDSEGKLTAVKEGEAEITISYDNKESGTAAAPIEKKITVKVGAKTTGGGGDSDKDGTGTGDKDGTGNGDGSGTGDKDGSGTGDKDGTGGNDKNGNNTNSNSNSNSNSSTDNSQKTVAEKTNDSDSVDSDKKNAVQKNTDDEEESEQYVAEASTSEATINGKTITVRKLKKSGSSGSGSSSQNESAAGASGSSQGGGGAIALDISNNIAGAVAGGVAVLLFALGIIFSYIKYRREF